MAVNDEYLKYLWKKTATMSKADYSASVASGVTSPLIRDVIQRQGEDSPENKESMERAKEFVRTHRFSQ